MSKEWMRAIGDAAQLYGAVRDQCARAVPAAVAAVPLILGQPAIVQLLDDTAGETAPVLEWNPVAGA